MRHQTKQQVPANGRIPAAVLFVDISGFTAVTETIMQQDREAAETLAEVMGDIFAPLVQAVYRRGGFITNFAGDAFTAVFPILPDASSQETNVAIWPWSQTRPGIIINHGNITGRRWPFAAR